MSRLRIPISEYDHHLGSLNASVSLVEYGDFQCPFCARAYSELEPLLEEFRKDLCFVFRHFPLRNSHPYAELAAMAAEAADQQDKFWPMHRALFQNQDALSEKMIVIIAAELGLDMERFGRDLSRSDLEDRINRDLAGGIHSGVNGTPSLYFNGQRFDGPATYAATREAIIKLVSPTAEHSQQT